jgi:hypothetical protein
MGSLYNMQSVNMYIHKQMDAGVCTTCTQIRSLGVHNSNAYFRHIRHARKLMYYICVYIVFVMLFVCVSMYNGRILDVSFTQVRSASDNEVMLTKLVMICFITIERVLYLTGVECILPILSDFLDIHIKHRSTDFLEWSKTIRMLRMVWYTFDIISWYIRLQCILWGVWYFVFCICIQLSISYIHVGYRTQHHPRFYNANISS